MLLKCFQFKCHLFLPGVLKDLELVSWKWSRVIYISNRTHMFECTADMVTVVESACIVII